MLNSVVRPLLCRIMLFNLVQS